MCISHNTRKPRLIAGLRRYGIRTPLLLVFLCAFVGLQVSLLWHNAEHATHNHDDSYLCDLSVVVPETLRPDAEIPFQNSLRRQPLKAVADHDAPACVTILSYRSRAPPTPKA